MNHSNTAWPAYLFVYIMIVMCMTLLFTLEHFHQKQPLHGINCVSNYNIISINNETSSYGEVHILFSDPEYIHVFFLGYLITDKHTYKLVRDIVLRYRMLEDNTTYIIDKMMGEKMNSDNSPDDVIKGFLFDKLLGGKETLRLRGVKNTILISDIGSPFFVCVIKQ